MEAIRESVEDYETHAMLCRAIDRTTASDRKADAVARAAAVLSLAADKVLKASDAHLLMCHEPNNRTVVDSVRVDVFKALTTRQD